LIIEKYLKSPTFPKKEDFFLYPNSSDTFLQLKPNSLLKIKKILQNYNNTYQITVTIGDIVVQSTPEGKVANPEELKLQIQQLVEDSIKQAHYNNQDRHFNDIGGLGT